MYQHLQKLVNSQRIVLLDGAIGTQLQYLGVPMDNTAWCAIALETHPDTVQHMHRLYIEHGVDIITTNTFSSARHNLEPIGLSDKTRELNFRAVELAMQARKRYANGRKIAVAGAISHFGIIVDGEPGQALHRHARPKTRNEITRQQARGNIREQAELLVEAGVDFLILESTGNMAQREWLLQETDHIDIQRWLGFRCRLDACDDVVRVGYSSDAIFTESLDILDRYRVDGVAIFHSLVEDTTAALPLLRDRFKGIIAVYPEAGREDYTATLRDPTNSSNILAADFPNVLRKWIDTGAQVVGGCCGINADYYSGLAQELGLTDNSYDDTK